MKHFTKNMTRCTIVRTVRVYDSVLKKEKLDHRHFVVALNPATPFDHRMRH